ncbi:hypothetical protein B6F29_00105 [Mycobacterium tuberculosis variant bovis]|uniref:Uncharacterized protein n=3 Tax=Mycobacterium tuberculosis complex TaxID=77643 RepID=Q8VIR1_MYCTO|nr:hypothetical protein MT4026.1 [Mycobacterium tuberculosis CDC1551]AKR03862.1 hypothetical protein Mb1595_p4339 [Mycobacterium tuberculosis variant bovis]ASD94036.1 hypothetical protein B7R63_21355 [Mycobacterium tuberculosis]AYP10509.1 hypothetical protein EBQ37_00310 [Mycobacterium tuberculosis variant bovis BCG]KAK24835.1 hypothetical protein AZ55_23145 [Mycobacterium tuberculosis CWCFVRF MDRTB 670]ORT83841.1 hypothetical protein BS299_17245 [Mycobacterium tuberculosis M13]PRH91300.1 hyp
MAVEVGRDGRWRNRQPSLPHPSHWPVSGRGVVVPISARQTAGDNIKNPWVRSRLVARRWANRAPPTQRLL